MRFQRREHNKSRPITLTHPHPTRHTAASYQARYLVGGNASLNRLIRYRRMERKETRS